jgi:hypothetical protein
MNEETAKQNIGCFFNIKNYKCQVIEVDSFFGVLHYGFVTAPESESETFLRGWIPVDFVGQCEW